MLARFRPSPAMFVACVALIVALGGSAYAVTALPKNSVGTKQLKNNAVTTPKIKADAVTGAKVKEASLAKVPRAGAADIASNALKLNGLASSSFERSTRIMVGRAENTNGSNTVLFSWPAAGWALQADGDLTTNDLGVKVTTARTDGSVEVMDVGAGSGIAEPTPASPYFPSNPHFMIVDGHDRNRVAVITCASSDAVGIPFESYCFGTRSEP